MRRAALLVLGVCLVELGLQAAAGFLSWRESRAAGAADWQGAETRILCLGESTTAPNDHAWPLQLQRLLDERDGPGRYAVINAAHGSTTSGILLARLPALLDRYRPQVVIAMMGANDSRWFGVYEDNALAPQRWRRWLARLKLPKLLLYAYREGLRSRPAAPAEEELRQLNAADDAGARHAASQSLYRRILNEAGPSSVTSAAGVRLAGTLPAGEAARVYATMAEHEAAEDGALGADGTFSPARQPVGPEAASPVTAENYRRLAELVAARGARLAAMQYPTLPLGQLEGLAPFRPGTIFIGNQMNFEAALRRRRYADIFVDRFGGSWGHCTAEGDRLIAQSALHGLEKAGVLK